MKKIIIGVLFVMMVFSQLQTAEASRFVDNNAALRYLMAIGFMPKLSDKTYDQLYNLNSLDSLKKIKAESRTELDAAVNSMGPIYRLLDLAAECTESTFLVDQNNNYETIVPPYRSIRQFARFLNACALIEAERGNHLLAAKTFINIFRLGVNLSRDHIIINASLSMTIQGMAIASINNLLTQTKDAEVKKVLSDYFTKLPKPILVWKNYLKSEYQNIANSLVMAEKNPALMADVPMFTDESEKSAQADRSSDSECAANQRVLLGATEMYLIDHEDTPKIKNSADFFQKLVDEKYLKTVPVCGNKGSYSINLVDRENFNVVCSCGVSPDAISTAATAESAKKVSPATIKKIEVYLKSEQYTEDKKTIEALFEEMMALDPFAPGVDEKAAELDERIEKHESGMARYLVLYPGSYYKTIREHQQRIDDLVNTLKK